MSRGANHQVDAGGMRALPLEPGVLWERLSREKPEAKLRAKAAEASLMRAPSPKQA